MKRWLIIFIFSYSLYGYSQIDSLDKVKEKSTLPVYFSTILPGAGQIYNGKWWKVPIIYGALGFSSYMYLNLDYQYHVLLQDLITRQNGFSYTISGITDIATLKSTKDQFRNWRDLTGIGIGVIWILNIIDAYVDAEFTNFDVSPVLSLQESFIYDFNGGQAVPAFTILVRF